MNKSNFMASGLSKNRTVMSKINFCRKVTFSVIVSLCALCLLGSCENNELDEPTTPIEASPKKFPGVYPMSITNRNATRAAGNGYWESWKSITLRNGTQIQAPWNATSTSSNTPHEFLEDVKYDDGWDLVFHLLEDNSGQGYQANSPYLIFHNRYTGILKVFYYLNPNAVVPNNNGYWQIKSQLPTSLFAFQNNPVSLITDKQTGIYHISNFAKNNSNGFGAGWNCFQIELAYDPSQSKADWLEISAYSSNEAQITLSGDFQSETQGLITTAAGSENYGKGLAELAGNAAENWISKKISDKTILGIPSSWIQDGVNSLVSKGVGKVFDAFVGLFKGDNTSSSSVQLTTKGTFTCSGNLTFTSATSIEGLDFCLNPDSIGYLGVWGLQAEPTLLLSPYAILKSKQEYTNGYTREYDISIANKSVKASMVINPNLKKFYKSCESITTYYQTDKYTRLNAISGNGSIGRDYRQGDRLYEDLYSPNYNIIADVAFIGKENAHIPIDKFDAPMEVFIPNVPNGPQGAIPDFTYHSRYVATIGVKITLPDGSEAHSYHRCIPKFGWKFSDYDNGFYKYFYPCEPVEQYD